MNFSRKKITKKFKPLPWACYAIITEYVGLFFILSNCSIESTFLLFCKILVCVVFAVANNAPYRSPLPGASITFLPLSQLRLVSFYLVLIFFFFTIMFSSSERGLVSEYLVKGISIFDFVLGHKSLEISLKFLQPRLLTTKQKWLWIYKNLICELGLRKKYESNLRSIEHFLSSSENKVGKNSGLAGFEPMSCLVWIKLIGQFCRDVIGCKT